MSKTAAISLAPSASLFTRLMASIDRLLTTSARVAVRNVRRDCHEHIRKLEHDHAISQDELHRSETDLQKLTDEQIKEIDKVGEEKEEELLTV